MPIYEKLMGNPFVDAGVCGICEWLGRNVQPEQITAEDLEQIVHDIAPIMQVDAGWKNLHGIFPNSVLTNPAYRKQNQVELLKKECKVYLETVIELGQTGDCMGCGRRAANTWLSRTNVPLTGAENSNFFSSYSEGAGYCFRLCISNSIIPACFCSNWWKIPYAAFQFLEGTEKLGACLR